MTNTLRSSEYAELIDPTTLRIERLLPGPIDRVWEYLVQGELRRKWFAAGDIPMQVGGSVELVWRNDELTDPSGPRPAEMSAENRMQSRVLDVDPPHRLAISWGDKGASVLFELADQADGVLFTITHRDIPDHASALNFGPGWHAHLDLLSALLTGSTPKPFWDEIARLKGEYAERFAY